MRQVFVLQRNGICTVAYGKEYGRRAFFAVNSEPRFKGNVRKNKNISDFPAQCGKQVACNAKKHGVRISWHYAHSRQKSITVENAALICGMGSDLRHGFRKVSRYKNFAKFISSMLCLRADTQECEGKIKPFPSDCIKYAY